MSFVTCLLDLTSCHRGLTCGCSPKSTETQKRTKVSQNWLKSESGRPTPTLRAQRLKKNQDLEIFKRDWKFQASRPPNPYFLWGILNLRDWNFQAYRMKFSSEIENFNRDWFFSIFGPLGKVTPNCLKSDSGPQESLLTLRATQGGGRDKGAFRVVNNCEQTQTNADKRRQTQALAEVNTWANASKCEQTRTKTTLLQTLAAPLIQKNLGVQKILVRKVWFYPPPPRKGPKWGKTVQISRKSSKLTLSGGGGGGTQSHWQNDFMNIWRHLWGSEKPLKIVFLSPQNWSRLKPYY